MGLGGIAEECGERPTEPRRLLAHPRMLRLRGGLCPQEARYTRRPCPHPLFEPHQHLPQEGPLLRPSCLAELHTRADMNSSTTALRAARRDRRCVVPWFWRT